MKFNYIIATTIALTGVIISLAGQKTPFPDKFSMHVSGVCGMCEERIEKAALETRGVSKANWEADSGELTVIVEPDSFNPDALHINVARAGHDTEWVQAKDEIYEKLPACCHYRNSGEDSMMHELTSKPKTQKLAFRVAGVCGMCRDRIEGVAKQAEGVITASWSSEDQYLTVEFESGRFDDSALLRQIAAAGHDTDLFEADEEAYANLPACCQYKDPDNPHYTHDNKSEAASISGRIVEMDDAGSLTPLIGANIYWVNSTRGTSSDSEGLFQLEMGPEDHQLVVSYVGFQGDTLHVPHDEDEEWEIILSRSFNMETIEIVHRKRTSEISLIDPIKVHQIGEGELMKAACCNLSESFVTTPSVDVSFTDAITGTRKIEMLGLAGKYVQISRENMPDVRGLTSIQGLTFIPGPWMEGMQLNMGTGSVVNGFESMTGQINIELKKPENSERFFLNLFGNLEGRFEANIQGSQVFNDRLSTALLTHGSTTRLKSDHNADGFMDMPQGNTLILLNRWKYSGGNGWRGQLGVKSIYVDRIAGQLDFDPNQVGPGVWGSVRKTRRTEGWLKTGRVFPQRPSSSIGFQLSVVDHGEENSFGARNYDATQQSLYANFIYQGMLSDISHQFRSGVSYQLDRIQESVSDSEFNRNESVPGAFFEYTFLPDDQFSLVSGLRVDWHSDFGVFVTPRLNLKWVPFDGTVLRLAAGKGQRTPSLFAENIGSFASSRIFNIRQNDVDTPYGLGPEVAWNTGINLTQEFRFLGQEGILSADAYHTWFENQIVVDMETFGEISFYQLDGKSYSTSFQMQLDYSPFHAFDLRMAWRYNNVQTQYDAGLLQKPLTSKHRAFLNLAYALEESWKFDLTLNWQGKMRIPDTSENPENYRLPQESPGFYQLNAQITKVWKNSVDIYLGGDNLLNFRQKDPILAADDPFSPYFDSSLVWGPVFGRNVYLGLRYRIN